MLKKRNNLPRPDEVDFSQWYPINLIFLVDEGERYQLLCQDHPTFLPRSARGSLEKYIFRTNEVLNLDDTYLAALRVPAYNSKRHQLRICSQIEIFTYQIFHSFI
jgi:hypothetical protein